MVGRFRDQDFSVGAETRLNSAARVASRGTPRGDGPPEPSDREPAFVQLPLDDG